MHTKNHQANKLWIHAGFEKKGSFPAWFYWPISWSCHLLQGQPDCLASHLLWLSKNKNSKPNHIKTFWFSQIPQLFPEVQMAAARVVNTGRQSHSCPHFAQSSLYRLRGHECWGFSLPKEKFGFCWSVRQLSKASPHFIQSRKRIHLTLCMSTHFLYLLFSDTHHKLPA